MPKRCSRVCEATMTRSDILSQIEAGILAPEEGARQLAQLLVPRVSEPADRASLLRLSRAWSEVPPGVGAKTFDRALLIGAEPALITTLGNELVSAGIARACVSVDVTSHASAANGFESLEQQLAS